MPESPDFEQIARQILTTRLTFASASEVSITHAVPQLAEQLRQVWNARGAADLNAIVTRPDGVLPGAAIKSLNR